MDPVRAVTQTQPSQVPETQFRPGAAAARVGGRPVTDPTPAGAQDGFAASASEEPSTLEFANQYLEEHGYRLTDDGRKVPLTDRQRQQIARSLSEFPIEVLREFDEAGIRFALANSEKTPKGGYPGLGRNEEWPRGVGGAYDDESKTVLLSDRLLEGSPEQVREALDHLVTHEGSHALDDLREGRAGDGVLDSRTDPRLDDIWDKHQDRRDRVLDRVFENHPELKDRKTLPRWVMDQITKKASFDDIGYALASKAEFLAVGIEYYLAGGQERAQLQERAPELYAYVQDYLAGGDG